MAPYDDDSTQTDRTDNTRLDVDLKRSCNLASTNINILIGQ